MMELIIRGSNSDYTLYLDNEPMYRAYRSGFCFGNISIDIIDADKILLARIKQKIKYLFNASIRIRYYIDEIETVDIIRKNIFSNIILLKYKNDTYKLISHKDNYKSIFKNDLQIGYYKLQTVEFSDEQYIKIVINTNEDYLFIFSVIMAWNGRFASDEDANITININFTASKIPFNKEWKPI